MHQVRSGVSVAAGEVRSLVSEQDRFRQVGGSWRASARSKNGKIEPVARQQCVLPRPAELLGQAQISLACDGGKCVGIRVRSAARGSTTICGTKHSVSPAK